MERDILKGVVEVEKDINQRLEIEQKKARKWLEEVKKEVESEVLAEESGLKANLDRTADEARTVARSKAAAIVDEAHAYRKKLDGLSDDVLKKIILRHLKEILPGV